MGRVDCLKVSPRLPGTILVNGDPAVQITHGNLVCATIQGITVGQEVAPFLVRITRAFVKDDREVFLVSGL